MTEAATRPTTRDEVIAMVDRQLTDRFVGWPRDWDKDRYGNVDHQVPVDGVIDSVADLICTLLGITSKGDDSAQETAAVDASAAEAAVPVDDIVADLGDFADGIDRNGFVHALGGHAETLRAAIAALQDRRAPSPWHWSDAARPEEGRRVVTLFEDGSGATIGYWTGTEVLDHDGIEEAWRDAPGAMWAYLPEGYELWCENRIDDPFTFPPAPGTVTE